MATDFVAPTKLNTKSKTHHPSLRSRAGSDTKALRKHGENKVKNITAEGAEEEQRALEKKLAGNCRSISDKIFNCR